MRISFVIPLIIFWCPFVNATSLRDQVQISVLKGETSSFKSDVADHLGIDRNLPYRALEKGDENWFRDFNVVLKDNKPLCLVLTVSSDTVTELQGRFYRATIKGKLEKAFEEVGQLDAGHKPIRGSGVITDLKITPEVRKAFQHELDFWLKGLYRKPTEAAAAGAPANVTPVH